MSEEKEAYNFMRDELTKATAHIRSQNEKIWSLTIPGLAAAFLAGTVFGWIARMLVFMSLLVMVTGCGVSRKEFQQEQEMLLQLAQVTGKLSDATAQFTQNQRWLNLEMRDRIHALELKTTNYHDCTVPNIPDGPEAKP